jgi:hypothetical protein
MDLLSDGGRAKRACLTHVKDAHLLFKWQVRAVVATAAPT